MKTARFLFGCAGVWAMGGCLAPTGADGDRADLAGDGHDVVEGGGSGVNGGEAPSKGGTTPPGDIVAASTITSVTPKQATTLGGEEITIRGTGFAGTGLKVRFGERDGIVMRSSDTEIVARLMPASVSAARSEAERNLPPGGLVDVEVAVGSGKVTFPRGLLLKEASFTSFARVQNYGNEYIYAFGKFFAPLRETPRFIRPIGTCRANPPADYHYVIDLVGGENKTIRAGDDLAFKSGDRTITLPWNSGTTGVSAQTYRLAPGDPGRPFLSQWRPDESYALITSKLPGGTAAVNVPNALHPPPRATLSAPSGSVDRNQPLVVSWAGANNVDYVNIQLDYQSVFYECYAPAGATSFTIPTAVLAAFAGKPSFRLSVGNVRESAVELSDGSYALTDALYYDVKSVPFR